MYIWVILATFLAMIASYSLSVRPDMREITVVPIAEAALSKFIAQHKAAKTYIKYHKHQYCGEDADGNQISICYSNADMSASLENYKDGEVILDSDSYKSKIYCMNSTLTAIVNEGLCAEDDVVKKVVTFGKIPIRWQNMDVDSFQPTNDFMNAMRNMVNTGEEAGYMAKVTDPGVTQKNPSGSDYRLIDKIGTKDVFIPKAIINDSEFLSVCSAGDCIVYMSGV